MTRLALLAALLLGACDRPLLAECAERDAVPCALRAVEPEPSLEDLAARVQRLEDRQAYDDAAPAREACQKKLEKLKAAGVIAEPRPLDCRGAQSVIFPDEGWRCTANGKLEEYTEQVQVMCP